VYERENTADSGHFEARDMCSQLVMKVPLSHRGAIEGPHTPGSHSYISSTDGISAIVCVLES